MFSVVQFRSDGAIAVVSDTWFATDNTIRWPRSRNPTKYKRMLAQHVPVAADCKLEQVDVLCKTSMYCSFRMTHVDDLAEAHSAEKDILSMSSGMSTDQTIPLTLLRLRYPVRRR